ncbi:isopeptide-forming domain-containing fimbrial protein, partial [Bacillus cereus]|uniref:isopeptide-forming domain-containing fimbrial protein n=1 Tax=Bacillus cereus TaxID=1396 RepID=UPI003D1865DE
LNDKPAIDSNEVTVIPPTPEQPNVHKDVEGKDHLQVETEKNYDYNVKTVVPKSVKGYKQLILADTLDNRLDIVSTKVLVDGKESDLKAEIVNQTVVLKLDRKALDGLEGKEVNLVITAKIKDGSPIEVIDNKAVIQLNDKPAIDSNTVTVIPPTPVTPNVTKDVEGKEHLDVEFEKEYNYNVKSVIPSNVDGYKTLTIADTLDNRLDIVDVNVLVDGKVSELSAKINGQNVKLVLDRKQLETLKGKEVNVQITSKIKGNTPIAEIPNGSSVQLNNNPAIDSNVVTVTPPTPVDPNIQKDVEGKEHYVVERNKEYNYNVKTKVDASVKGYKTLTLKDTLDKRLTVVKATVLVDGYVDASLKPVVKGQDVTLELNRSQLDKLAGKEVTLKITSKINKDTPIELVPNKATIQLNDKPAISSNEVTVIPPEPNQPNIHKDVEGKDHLEIEHGKDYNYNVKTKIVDNVAEYKSITLKDTLDNRLNVVKTKVFVDGKESDLEAKVEGQVVTLTLDRTQLDTLVGKEVSIQITANIKDGTPVELIDNVATIQLNNADAVESNKVTVIPPKPPVTPEVTKDVEGKQHLEIEKGKEYNYNVKTNVPSDVTGYKELTLKDVLDGRLTIVNTKVFIDGEESDFKSTVKGQTVELKLNREQLETIKGKRITLVITSKINENVAVELIENKATIKLNNNGEVDSNTVTVIPPKPVEPPVKPPVEPPVTPV